MFLLCPPHAMNGHVEVPNKSPEAACPCRLLLCKHPAPVSPLECALPRFPITVHSKRLTQRAKCFRMRTYAKTGGRGPLPFPPSLPSFTLKETFNPQRPPVFHRFFQVPYAVSPLFAALTKTAGVYPLSSRSGTPHSFTLRVAEGSLAYPELGGTSRHFEFKDSLHPHPLLSRLHAGQRLLELPHQLFPLAHFGICRVGFRLPLKRKTFVHFHHHEHPRPQEIDLHVQDSRVANALGDFRPNFFVIAPVLRNQFRIVFQVQRQAVSFGHVASAFVLWSSLRYAPDCHPERSEGSLRKHNLRLGSVEILRASSSDALKMTPGPSRLSRRHSLRRRQDRTRLISTRCEIQNVGVTKQWNPKSPLDIRQIGDLPHDGRHDRSSDDGHNQQRRATLGERAKVLDAQRENRGKHDRMKESDEHHGINRDCAAGGSGDHRANQRASSENGQQPRRSDGLHQRRAREATDHEAYGVHHQISGRRARTKIRLHAHHEPNDEAADANLRADVKELRNDGAVKMFVSENTTPAGGSSGFLKRGLFVDVRQLRKVNDGGDHEKNAANDQVRNANRGGLRRAIGLQCRRAEPREILRARHGSRKDQRPDDIQRDDVADAVERLREIQAALTAFRWAENRRVGISGDFEKALAAGKHERRKQEKPVNAQRPGGNKEEGSRSAKKQAAENSSAVADALHQAPSDQRSKKVAAEEGHLNERGLEIAKTEGGLEVRDEDIVQIDAEGPKKKQAGDQDERENVFSFR